MTEPTETDREHWPQWLKDARTENARVEITAFGRVIWHGGVWRDGVWRDGDWHGGHTSATRCMYSVTGDGKHIYIGCEKRTPDEWEKVISGDIDPPGEAPARDSEQWRLLVAAFRAQVAYQKELKEGT